MSKLSEKFLSLDDINTITIVANNLERVMMKSCHDREYAAYQWSKEHIAPKGNIKYRMEFKPTDCPLGKYTDCKLLPHENGIGCEVILDNVNSGRKYFNCWDI